MPDGANNSGASRRNKTARQRFTEVQPCPDLFIVGQSSSSHKLCDWIRNLSCEIIQTAHLKISLELSFDRRDRGVVQNCHSAVDSSCGNAFWEIQEMTNSTVRPKKPHTRLQKIFPGIHDKSRSYHKDIFFKALYICTFLIIWG